MKKAKIVGLAVLIAAVATVTGFAQAGSAGDARGPSVTNFELTVRSNVRGADVYIDGVRQRETAPATFTLRPGSYTVRVEARGYQAWQARIQLESNQTIVADLVPPTATILLQIPNEFLNDQVRDPWRLIDLSIDGRLRTESRIEVDPGYHDVSIASGGLKIDSEFYFEAGRTYTLELIMRLGFFQSGR